MELPRFILADNTECPEDIFVIHTEFPRFIINLKDDEIELWDDLEGSDEEELSMQVAQFIEEASEFYDEEMKKYSE
ncbi:hypothetical protein [Wenyingzhuangia marina]|uniref:Uncharacterized protein n=1 Tax=Wenyingzhuangia marina TaxID=1195760 RepID=A0A1M5W871_9FLAO|nr:hypothetical protein [Wenyingzhuangia marina]GGF75319.1 hypothetical protein GCM10011397_17860 [Wenyingzhuangia marina]SHH83393.1 hypothetical protein SAMN05444281_2282 [Wenyingzhuangia marina]